MPPLPEDRPPITSRQYVTDSKLAFARQLRREMTPQERIFWERLRDRRLNGWKFRRQQLIDGFIADFFCAAIGVVLELDGAVHHDQQEYDAHRDRSFAARDLLVIRIPNERIERELDAVLAELAEACEARRPHPPAPSP